MFEFLGVLISVILGLALTHLLRGLAKVIHMRRTAKPYWVHIVWTCNTLLYALALWWGMSSWNALRSWTFEWYLFIAGICQRDVHAGFNAVSAGFRRGPGLRGVFLCQ